MTNPSTLLVVMPAWVGDCIMAQPLLVALKSQHQCERVEVIVPPQMLTLCQRMAVIDGVHCLDCPHGSFGFGQRLELAKQLKEQCYKLAVTLPNSWKSALVPWLARVPLRIGWLGEMRIGLLNSYQKLNKSTTPFMTQRFYALAHAFAPQPLNTIPYPQIQCNQENQARLAKQFNLNVSQPKLVLCPGAAYGPAKQWPATHYAKVAKQAITLGWQVLLLGSPNEQAIADLIQTETECQCINLVAKTKLGDAIDVMGLADKVVCNDSGMMHIAAALDKEIVALFGSSSPDFTPPLSDNAQILQQSLGCQPCYQRECPLQHTKCLVDISPEQVMQALQLSEELCES